MQIGNDHFWLQVINKFGFSNQLDKLNEELFELGAASHHYLAGKVTERQLVSEMVDVAIMIHQLTLYSPNMAKLFEEELAYKTMRMDMIISEFRQS